MSNSYTLHNIQALRAIAAIMVVMHHAFPHYQAMGTTLPLLQSISNWGFVGVDIFFIISGFIMAYTTFNKPRGLQSAKTFIKHRLFRIYLGYWPFFIAMLAIVYVTHRVTSLDVVGSFFLYNSDMFQLVLPVSWSLSYELYFYLLFIATFFLSRTQLYIYVPLFIVVLLFLILSSSIKSFLPLSFFYSPFLLEFFMGVLLYMYREHLMKRWVLIVAIITMILAFNYGVTHESKNGLIRILTFGTSAFSFVLIALIVEYNKFYTSSGFLVALGNASFTLYLVHPIVLELFYYTGIRSLFESTGILLPLLGFFFILLLSIGFSLIYYKLVERPIYQKAITYKQGYQ